MKSFKNEIFLNEWQASSKLMELIVKLDKIHNSLKDGVVKRKIVKELGSGYNKDFSDAAKKINDAIDILQEIQMDADRGGV